MILSYPKNLALISVSLLVVATGSSLSLGAVSMSQSAGAPATGLHDQFDFADDATVPGGTTPGGGTYNSQAFSDNAGPPGQIFTTPGSAPFFTLNSVSLKGANTGGGNSGGVFGTSATWGLRISSVSGTALLPINTVTGIPTVSGATGIEWYTWSFTGADALSLNPSTQYAFEVFSSAGYLGFDADTSDGYAGGTAFNSAGSARSFNNNTTGNLANHIYDRTFHVSLGVEAPPQAGDVDGDGDVDLDDFEAIRDHFRMEVTSRSMGDLDENGFVDFVDFGEWKDNFPFSPPGSGSSTGVPEPSSWILGLAASLLILCGVRQSRRLGYAFK